MGEAQSKECADEKGTDNLSAQDAEDDIKKLQQIAENEGSNALTEYINEILDGWKEEQVKFAITGRAATGKSTFINKMRNLEVGADGFAEAGSGDTTLAPTLYIHPKNHQIAFYDLPGYSTITFKKEDYISEMQISDYDLVFIFFNNVLSEDEKWLVGELRKLGKPFCLVRSKIDLDIDSAKFDGKDKEMVIPEIKEKIKRSLEANPEFKDTKAIFLISSRYPDLGEWSDLLAYVEDNIDKIKARALLFSLESTTTQILERKHEMLKKRLVVVSALGAVVAAFPVPGVSEVINTAGLVDEVRHYMRVFGVEPELVNTLKEFDHSLLKCRSLFKPNLDMGLYLGEQIGMYTPSGFARSWINVLMPIVGSVISSVATAIEAYRFLEGMLQNLKEDALQIYGHINKTNTDDRK